MTSLAPNFQLNCTIQAPCGLPAHPAVAEHGVVGRVPVHSASECPVDPSLASHVASSVDAAVPHAVGQFAEDGAVDQLYVTPSQGAIWPRKSAMISGYNTEQVEPPVAY